MNDEDFSEEIKSKTRLKDEMHELQSLGEALLALPLSVYHTLPVPENLDSALTAARKITAHGARRRQMQFIGKVMRSIDAAPLQAAYDEWKSGNKKLAREHQNLEELRDSLIAGDKAVMDAFIQEHQNCDIQQLRQLIRLAQQEKKLEKPPRNYRKLFQFLKDA
jgi:ribosome-associated protein